LQNADVNVHISYRACLKGTNSEFVYLDHEIR